MYRIKEKVCFNALNLLRAREARLFFLKEKTGLRSARVERAEGFLISERRRAPFLFLSFIKLEKARWLTNFKPKAKRRVKFFRYKRDRICGFSVVGLWAS
jgi:hypothetical protein